MEHTELKEHLLTCETAARTHDIVTVRMGRYRALELIREIAVALQDARTDEEDEIDVTFGGLLEGGKESNHGNSD